MGTVRVEDHHYPEGEEFTVPGLGMVKNFEDTEVDDVQIATFKGMGFEWPEDQDTLTFVSQEPEPEEEQPVESVEEGTPADVTTGGES
jgi:hypothetical protein